ncbi:MAG: PIG-L family deacetylase [Gemmatimonadetes bacterium]|nr:PIG-L family deacetylase [Gemmatimonadota bacterium]
MSILVVVAHPDDEVLGCGATVSALTRAGASVTACILSGTAAARRHRPAAETLEAHTRAASDVLGMRPPILGDFPNIALNTVPHLELVQFVEAAIEREGAHTIFTHHPADLNDDHLQVSRAAQAAARLWLRRPGIPSLRALYFMEVLSSTDWAFPVATAPFRPDAFIGVEPGDIERKIEALSRYEGVMRPFPHSRSREAIEALATLRGAQAGRTGAEAFQTAFAAPTPATLRG